MSNTKHMPGSGPLAAPVAGERAIEIAGIDWVELQRDLDAFLAENMAWLVAFRHDLHMHPELGLHEHRTTDRIMYELTALDLRPVRLPKGTGVLCEFGSGDGPVVGLRADIDALPLADEKDVPYRSTVPGVCHACGHDVHTTVLLGVARFLAQRAEKGLLPGRVRLIFQPAEETIRGALDVMAAGGTAGLDRIFALHCDPRTKVGQLGVRVGPITAARDKIKVTVTGPGGHTARPHETADVVYGLSKIVTELPAALSRRVDPRSSLSLVWGSISAGEAPNVIPDYGIVEGTVRCVNEEAWKQAPEMIKALVQAVASQYDLKANVDYERGVPPTVNEETSVKIIRVAVASGLGDQAVTGTPQSLGGEDFSWYLQSVPGALVRLGVRDPESEDEVDLHRGDFDIAEGSIETGVCAMVAITLAALLNPSNPSRV
jgi:amidohydrolase